MHLLIVKAALVELSVFFFFFKKAAFKAGSNLRSIFNLNSGR